MMSTLFSFGVFWLILNSRTHLRDKRMLCVKVDLVRIEIKTNLFLSVVSYIQDKISRKIKAIEKKTDNQQMTA